MQNVTLRQIEAFVAVAEELHFGRAAQRLSVSPPWMSHTVRDLERALHVTLLIRTTRSVELTPAGQVFAGLASQVLSELASAIKTVRSVGTTPRQTVKLGYTIGAGLEIVPRLLRTYLEREPGAGVETEEFDFADPTAGLRDSLVNAAVVRPPLGLPGLVSVELATERIVACLPDNHHLAARQELSIADVLPEPIVAAPVSPGPWRDYWILTDYRSGPAPVVAEASTLDAEMHLVSRGVGLSITSEAVGLWYRRPGVTFVPIADLDPCSVSLAWWPQDTVLVAQLAAVAHEVRAGSAD
ncbi:MAG: LysR family transcriptional regulator [Actinomycetota bacterium]|nr:LysR family transcriptional regulator [Actinomycetota bacterium]